MRLFLLTSLTMIAFAANSVLNRLALTGGDIGPAEFAAIRVAAGAAMLLALVLVRGGRLPAAGWRSRLIGAGTLALYMVGFSFAYLSLDAGLGALILFGGVQVTMFAGGLWAGERPTIRRWLGAGVALAGLVWLMWPGGEVAPDPLGAGLMAAAAVGWGVYSLAGRGSAKPLASTAANFLYAFPVTLLVFMLLPDAGGIGARGAGLAVLSGAVTSGLGYALWYAVLPRLQASAAAVAQLTVPVIAMAGGALVMGEAVTLPLLMAAGVVLGGVALSLSRPARR